jgi:Zn finger protein HypA/HybF involved in hydrogenase expression
MSQLGEIQMTDKKEQLLGRCMLCDEVVSKQKATVHLKKCVEQQPDRGGRKVRLLHLAVEATYLPMYWLHLELAASRTLDLLDSFLRNIWLECCGHLSCFTIAGERYSVQPMPGDLYGFGGSSSERSMNQKVYNVLSKGMKLEHEYDFGSTTNLELRVVGDREGQLEASGIRLLVRNEPPSWQCRECGKPATLVEAQGWGIEPEQLLCDTCARGVQDQEMLLPLVNSPRAGVCGYTGQ